MPSGRTRQKGLTFTASDIEPPSTAEVTQDAVKRLGGGQAVTTLEIADELGITRIGANSRLMRAAEAGLVVRVARAEWVVCGA